jgi:arylsulfatase A-like enzyme
MFDAAVEALDTEFGRLLNELGPERLARTLVVFLGDNGTTRAAVTWPLDPNRAKGTVYEGGIRIPLIVAGPEVAQGRECAALVNVTDLFLTLADAARVHAGRVIPSGTPLDSYSLAPYLSDPDHPSIRTLAFAEHFAPNGPPDDARTADRFYNRAIRDARYKLIRRQLGGEEFYDLESDPRELENLFDRNLTLPELARYVSLRAQMQTLTLP